MFTESEDAAEFENYLLWLSKVREENGFRGVARATFRFYIENQKLRAELRRRQSAPPVQTGQPGAPVVRTTPRQQSQQGEQTRANIMRFLRTYIEQNGQAPSQLEIARAVGISKGIIGRHLRRLERDGEIELQAGVDRGIRLK